MSRSEKRRENPPAAYPPPHVQSAARELERLVAEGEVVGALLWDGADGLTQREQELVRQAFQKGIEIGREIAHAQEPKA